MKGPLLVLEDVHTYYGESHVLQGISLEIGRGEAVCLLGRNGAGKTTTLRSIIGLTPLRRGKVVFKGEEVQKRAAHRIAKLGVGFVPEDRRIFPEPSVEDNLKVVQAQREKPRWPLARIFETFPLLADIRHRPGDYLSGGQQQMLAIARALVAEPDLLLLDEPNEGLAPVIVEDIGKLLDELAGETTLLFTEHKLRFSLKHAERAILIEKGQVRFEGSTAELEANKEVQERYLGV